MMWQKHPGSRMSVPLGKLILFTSLASGASVLVYYLMQSEPASCLGHGRLLCSCSSIKGNTC
uniref:Cytochrome c oxidase assembly factor 1 n=1 Tax=Prolemur simus TaxID=1328070 RepID=A0A8C8ZZQ9_PROSS